jgi:hypothetical protein
MVPASYVTQTASPPPTSLIAPTATGNCTEIKPTFKYVFEQGRGACVKVECDVACTGVCGGWSKIAAQCTLSDESESAAGTAGADTTSNSTGPHYCPVQLEPRALSVPSTPSDLLAWINAGWLHIDTTLYRYMPLSTPWEAAVTHCNSFGPDFKLVFFEEKSRHWNKIFGDAKKRNSNSRMWMRERDGDVCSIVMRKGSGKNMKTVQSCNSKAHYYCGGPATAPFPRCAAVGGGVQTDQTQRPANTRRNVVMMVADDWGWGDVPEKNSDLVLPEIHKMQQQSVQFERFYTSPVCSPTRGTLLTGVYPARHGVTLPNANGPGALDGVVKRSLSINFMTLPEALKSKCYRTGFWGKCTVLSVLDRTFHSRMLLDPTIAGLKLAYVLSNGIVDSIHLECPLFYC